MHQRIKSKKYAGVYFRNLDNHDITYKNNNKKVCLKIGLHSEGISEAFCN